LRVAKLDPYVLTFGVAEALETAAECIRERMRRRCRHQYADARHFSGLLGQRATRPDEQIGRQDTDHIAPSHIAPRARGYERGQPARRRIFCWNGALVEGRHLPHDASEQTSATAAFRSGMAYATLMSRTPSISSK